MGAARMSISTVGCARLSIACCHALHGMAWGGDMPACQAAQGPVCAMQMHKRPTGIPSSTALHCHLLLTVCVAYQPEPGRDAAPCPPGSSWEVGRPSDARRV